MALTLDALLADPGLRLRAINLPEDAGREPIRGVHAELIDTRTPRLERAWLLVTNGTRLRGDQAAQTALAEAAASAGLTAIVIRTGPVFRVAPAALRQAAESLGVALVACPATTPAEQVIAAVDRAIVTPDIEERDRALATVGHLGEAFAEPHPARAVVRRLGAVTDATVALFAADGGTLAATGEGPIRSIWSQLTRRDRVPCDFAIGRWLVAAHPVEATPESAAWIALATRDRGGFEQVIRRHVQAAARLAQSAILIDDARGAEDRQRRALLLRELLEPDAGSLPVARLIAVGLDPAGPARAIAVSGPRWPAPETPARLALQRRTVRSLIEASLAEATPALATIDGERVIALAQVQDREIERWLEIAAEQAGPLRAGVGRTVRMPGPIASSLRDATLALPLAGRGAIGRVATIDAIGLGAWLLASAPPDAIATRVQAFLAPLEEKPLLRDTLVSYLAHGTDIPRTARALHVHPNSLRYRLGRIEQALGRSLRDVDTIVEARLALSASGGAGRGRTIVARRGRGDLRLSTDEIMALTRGVD